MDWSGDNNVVEYRVFMEVNGSTRWGYENGEANVCVPDSWIAFAPVAGLTRDYFGLASTTPVNWLSTVVLFVYCVVSPLTAYVYHHRGVRTGVSILFLFLKILIIANHRCGVYYHWSVVEICGCKS